MGIQQVSSQLIGSLRFRRVNLADSIRKKTNSDKESVYSMIYRGLKHKDSENAASWGGVNIIYKRLFERKFKEVQSNGYDDETSGFLGINDIYSFESMYMMQTARNYNELLDCCNKKDMERYIRRTMTRI